MKKITLFDYQKEMKARVEEAFQSHQSVMVQMPTGTGKTMVLASIVLSFLKKSERPVWIVAHRRELVAQIEDTVSKITPSLFTLKEDSSRIRAVSIQWLSRHGDEWAEVPGMIVIDEAHHALAATYQELWRRFPKAKFLGLTATPCRLSGKGFTDLFEVLVQSWSIPEFIKQGRLASYDFVSIRTDSVTQGLIDSLRKRGADGDYQTKEMDQVLNKRPSIERLYHSFADFAHDKKGIVYAINIAHARSIADYYQAQGVNAVAIDAKTPAEERQRLIERFKQSPADGADSLQVLVNVDIFSEGFDCPDVEFVQLARPTLSLAKYLQMVGRGLRVAKGKRSCMMIDNVGLYRVFGLPSQAWDWKAMFLGSLKPGRRKGMQEREFFLHSEKQEPISQRQDSEMMMVVSHEDLLQSLLEGEMVDHEGDFAIVKLADGRLTVVDRQGERIIKPDHYQGMRLLKGGILTYRPRRKAVCYYDLVARSMIDEGTNTMDTPGVITLQGWEFIVYGDLFLSRTQEEFSLPYCPSPYDLFDCGHYLIYDLRRQTSSGCQVWTYKEGSAGMYLDKENSEQVCFLRDDHVHVYWLCATLYGGDIVVMDRQERYYLVDAQQKKTYIGCNRPKSEAEDLSVVMPRLGRRYYEAEMRRQRAQEKKSLQQMHAQADNGKVELYQAGKKWGIKLDGKVVVPPLYCKISPPVGAYCAFEQMPFHWGVMTLRGHVLVEAKYEKVEIKDSHTALVTSVTGKTQEIALY